MPTRAIRGATVVAENTETAILIAARKLLEHIARANELNAEAVISIIFTLTRDLDAAYPTRAAREMGWTQVALLDAQQPEVAGDLPHCIRVLIHCESELALSEIKHVYLGNAKRLRPDISE
jgi:chorismate mutase